MKIRRVGSELCHADGWTDGHKNSQRDMKMLIADFRNFSKAPKQLILNFLHFYCTFEFSFSKKLKFSFCEMFCLGCNEIGHYKTYLPAD